MGNHICVFVHCGEGENKVENNLSYIPSGQTLMIGLKKSNTWYAQLLR